MFVSASCTIFAVTFHPEIAVLLSAETAIFGPFAIPTAFAFSSFLFGSSIGSIWAALSGIVDMATLSFPVKHVVHASDKPFVSAMFIALVL